MPIPPAARCPGERPLSLDPSRDDPAPDADEGPPSLISELGHTRAAAGRLIGAHIALAKAELSLIADHAKTAIALLGAALALVLFAGLLASVGTPLFLGEWLFGSLGWGILHGVLFAAAAAVTAVMLALDMTPQHVLRTFVGAVILGAVVGAILFFNLFHAAWAGLGDELTSRTTVSIDAAYRPLVVGAAVVGTIGAFLGLVFGATRGRSISAAIGGLLGGAIVGAALGAFTAISFSVEVAVAIGIAIALATWPALVARPLIAGTYDVEALKSRYWPGLTMETARETIDQLKTRVPDMPTPPAMPRRPGSPGGRAR